MIPRGTISTALRDPSLCTVPPRQAVKPVWREQRFEPRTLVPLAVSYDHRVIDGGNAARFMVELVQAIEGLPEADVKV